MLFTPLSLSRSYNIKSNGLVKVTIITKINATAEEMGSREMLVKGGHNHLVASPLTKNTRERETLNA